ncbi:YceG family protein [Metabacillus lacus]|nr:YceG family protein [Metabacillus lacus]
MEGDRKIEILQAEMNIDNWLIQLSKSPVERKGFLETGGMLSLPALSVFVKNAPQQKIDSLVYDKKLSVHVLSSFMDNTISSDMLSSTEKILRYSRKKNMGREHAAKEIMLSLLPQLHPSLKEHFHQCTEEIFQRIHSGKLPYLVFKRVCIDLIKWSHNHLQIWVEEADFDLKQLPKIMWRGKASQSEQYFLLLLMKFGFDVVCFGQDEELVFTDVPLSSESMQMLSYHHQISESSKSTPASAAVEEKRTATPAYRASKEIEELLSEKNSLYYRPWQFREHRTSSLTLKTTYEEMFMIGKQPGSIRPGFQAGEDSVRIPVLFSKVLGVSKNRRRYWRAVQELMQQPQASTIKSFPFTRKTSSINPLHYSASLAEDSTVLDPEKMVLGEWWKYTSLPKGFQLALASAISRHCERPRLKQLKDETLFELQLYLFHQALQIPKDMLILLQNFDLPHDVPKLILYHNENNGYLTRSDAALLLLLNEFGIDLILFNPPGRLDLEKYIEEQYFDNHWLEEMSYGEGFREPSAVKRLLRKWF